jgi:hypothetical protein
VQFQLDRVVTFKFATVSSFTAGKPVDRL